MASQAKQKHPETMEEVLNSIKHACELTKKIESELPNMANHPDMLSSSIDDVVKAFMAAKERLSMMMMVPQQDQAIAGSSFAPMLQHEAMQMGATSMQEWIKSPSYAHTMDQLLLQMQQQPFDVRALMGGVDLQQLTHRGTLQIGEMGGRDVEGSEKSKGSEGEAQGIEASPSRPRKRKNDAEKKTRLVPAPQVGNADMPPEDGFTWRKYGQKEILGSKYPRSYYRCTHQKLYACPAKKQVQRLDHSPNIFEVTYRGEHTCHKSLTAPSSFPPPPQLLVDIPMDMAQSTSSTQLSPSSTSISTWLQSSVNLSLGGGGGGGSSSRSGSGMAPAGSGEGGSGGASTSKYGTDYLVAEMADAMFNSGSSSGNCSMESLFPAPEDKWDPSEKKS